MSSEIVPAEPTPIERERTILDVIAEAARDPSVDVAKLERLLAIQERLVADQRRTAFMAAKARLQEKLPQILKEGRVTVNGVLRSRYARIEDVDTAIRPLCAEEGFAFSFDSKQLPNHSVEYSCEMSHRDGHSETRTLTMPIDTGSGRNAVQSVGSTTSYARRYLLGMHLHLVTRDEDDDGNGGQAPITAEQAERLRVSLIEAKGNEARFLKWLGVASFKEILAGDYARAEKFIEEKKRRAAAR